MKLEKKHYVIIGVVVAIILVWYFFLRKKKAESGFAITRPTRPVIRTGTGPTMPTTTTGLVSGGRVGMAPKIPQQQNYTAPLGENCKGAGYTECGTTKEGNKLCCFSVKKAIDDILHT